MCAMPADCHSIFIPYLSLSFLFGAFAVEWHIRLYRDFGMNETSFTLNAQCENYYNIIIIKCVFYWRCEVEKEKWKDEEDIYTHMSDINNNLMFPMLNVGLTQSIDVLIVVLHFSPLFFLFTNR